jgi:hypothetical protein
MRLLGVLTPRALGVGYTRQLKIPKGGCAARCFYSRRPNSCLHAQQAGNKCHIWTSTRPREPPPSARSNQSYQRHQCRIGTYHDLRPATIFFILLGCIASAVATVGRTLPAINV